MIIWYAQAWFGEKLTGGPSGKNAGFTCGATGGLGKCGTMPNKKIKCYPQFLMCSKVENKCG